MGNGNRDVGDIASNRETRLRFLFVNEKYSKKKMNLSTRTNSFSSIAAEQKKNLLGSNRILIKCLFNFL